MRWIEHTRTYNVHTYIPYQVPKVGTVPYLHVPGLDGLKGLVGRVDGARPQLQGGVDDGAHVPVSLLACDWSHKLCSVL